MFTVGVVLFVLGILLSIALHELGHFLPARKFGVRVSQFMVGFGPTLYSRTKGQTQFGIKAIPLGGYVRIIGMIEPKAMASKGIFKNIINQTRSAASQDLMEADRGHTFYELHPGKKIVVMLGGPIMNLFIAVLLLFTAFIVIGTPQPTNQINAIVDCLPSGLNEKGKCEPDAPISPALNAGLEPGDLIVSVSGTEVSGWDDLVKQIDDAAGQTVQIQVDRGGQTSTLIVSVADITSNEKKDGYLGFQPKFTLERQSLLEIPRFIWLSAKGIFELIVNLPQRISGVVAAVLGDQPRDPNGPISVVGVTVIGGELAAAEAPLIYRGLDLLVLMAGMNLALFFFNLLPLLPLDGGHILGASVEWVRKLFARLRGKPDPGAFDTARLSPLAFIFGIFLLGFTLLLIYADIVAPISLN